MTEKKSRSDSQKKADTVYEKKRLASLKMFGARFNSEDLELIKKAVDVAGSNHDLILEGAKLILEKNK
ncbi:hypothetical protein GYW75_03240 [Gilliamella sp. ESL0232]|uniref:hypothetical protein n=1 Tax=Gilliamella sp. ESL0232 TaxID=2705037 RepID=UPI00158122EE|nr:hypothetical protein [Gilliamella sp. ESL0232]NUE95401.1 hypothetical protein [Gilliamella sp. ESL0232]